jgi:hypothetical protein
MKNRELIRLTIKQMQEKAEISSYTKKIRMPKQAIRIFLTDLDFGVCLENRCACGMTLCKNGSLLSCVDRLQYKNENTIR